MAKKKQEKAKKTKHKLSYANAIPVFISVVCVAVFSWFSLNTPTPKKTTIRDISVSAPTIAYCNDKDPSLTLEMYYPKIELSSDLPLIVYIHGGGWRWGDESGPLIDFYGSSFIKKGIAVAAIDYRLTSKSPYPDQNNDIACALSYINNNADQLHVDTKKIIYFGDSAGGQLAAFAALNIPFHDYTYTAPVGVIDFYGVSDFSKIINGVHPDLNARRYLGKKYSTIAAQASPVTYITKNASRFIFFHGNKDLVVPISQSKTFYDKLIAAGVDSEYVVIDGAGHAFMGPELPAVEYKKIQDSLDVFLSQTIGK